MSTGTYDGRAVGLGDRVDVVLDAVVENRGGAQVMVVHVRQVAPHGMPAPELLPGATRNVWQTWLGVVAQPGTIGALAVEIGPAPTPDPNGRTEP